MEESCARDACVFVSEFNNPPKANNLISFSHRIVARVSLLLPPSSSERDDGSVENMVRVIKRGGRGSRGRRGRGLESERWLSRIY